MVNTPAYCIHCGESLRPGAKFCPKCGKPVGEELQQMDAPREPAVFPAQPGDVPPPAGTMVVDYTPVELQSYGPIEPIQPVEPPKPVFKNPWLWVVAAVVASCLLCLVVGLFVFQRTLDLFDFNDEIETLGSVVPGLEEMATQMPEIEQITTQIPEIETITTQMPEMEQLATGLPDLEQLVTDLPLPEIEIELP